MFIALENTLKLFVLHCFPVFEMSGYVAQVATPQAVMSQQVFRLLSGDENTRCDITDQAVTTGATRLKT